jgi:hypothetical protein
LPQVWSWFSTRSTVMHRWHRVIRILMGAAALLIIGLLDTGRSSNTSGVAQKFSSNQAYITRAEYGKAWPFTVEGGLLTGDASRGIPSVTFTVGETTYAVNGVAAANKLYAKLQNIWAADPEIPGLCINMSPIIDRGLSLAGNVDQPFIAVAKQAEPESIQKDVAPIRCDTFKINADFDSSNSSDLREGRIALQTDLPDYTEVMVSIDRSWVNEAEGETYAEAYISEKSTVGQWRKSRTVILRNSQFASSIEKRKALFRQLGEPLSIGNIDSSIEVRFTVPVNQANARFSPLNRNLEGAAVEVSGRLRIVHGVSRILWPLPGASSQF